VTTYLYKTLRPLPGFDKLASDRLTALASAGIEVRPTSDGTDFRIEIDMASPEAAADLLNQHLELDSVRGEVLTADDLRPAA
jgi:hypothetical protein